MGATDNIKETNITAKIEGKFCDRNKCRSLITSQDIEEDNFAIFFDTSNDVELRPLLGGWYQLGIAIRSLEHKYCPNKEDE